MFSTSIDVITHVGDRAQLLRRLLPPAWLGPLLYTTKGERLAILWQLWLTCGPSMSQLIKLTEKVRSVTTDMGTEYGIVSLEDMIPLFCKTIGAPLPPMARSLTWPAALPSPGWNHLFDIVLRWSLCQLPWFPQWIKELKALNNMLIERRGAISTEARQLAYVGFADVLTQRGSRQLC